MIAAVHADFARFILPTETRFDNMCVARCAAAAWLSRIRHVLVVWAADVGPYSATFRPPAPPSGQATLNSRVFETLFVTQRAVQRRGVEERG